MIVGCHLIRGWLNIPKKTTEIIPGSQVSWFSSCPAPRMQIPNWQHVLVHITDTSCCSLLDPLNILKCSSLFFSGCPHIWVYCNILISARLGMISLIYHDSSEGRQWGRENLPRHIFKPFAQRKVHLLQPKDFGPKPQADPRSLRSKARLHWTEQIQCQVVAQFVGKVVKLDPLWSIQILKRWVDEIVKWENISPSYYLYIYLHFLCTYTWIWWDCKYRNHSELGGAPLCSRSMSWWFCSLLAFKLRVGSRWFPKLPEFWLSKLSEITPTMGQIQIQQRGPFVKSKGKSKFTFFNCHQRCLQRSCSPSADSVDSEVPNHRSWRPRGCSMRPTRPEDCAMAPRWAWRRQRPCCGGLDGCEG
jgi:hypothetical protein